MAWKLHNHGVPPSRQTAPAKEMHMKRRDFVTGAAAAGVALAAPHVARAAGKPLTFVPQANLANLDPIWGTQYVVRNASLLIWDTLYGVDETLTPKPQMAEG